MSKLNVVGTLNEPLSEDYQHVYSFSCQNALDDYEYVESLNQETTFDNDTKLLIVGTLTPPKGKEKYFYSTTSNSIYGLIDEALNNGGKLENLKRQFKDYNDSCSNKNEVDSDNKVVRDKIKEYLKDNKIAFLDVVKYAIRNKYSSSDEDIVVAELDYDEFKDLENVKKIIVNSRAAEDALKKIFNKIFGDPEIYNEKVIYLSQNRRGLSRERWAELKEKWLEEIRNTLNIQS